MYNIKLLFPKLNLPALTYKSNRALNIGDIVLAPLRNKNVSGVVVEQVNESSAFELKEIKEESPFTANITAENIKFIQRAARYYYTTESNVMKLCLPVDVNESPIKQLEQEIDISGFQLLPLNKDQTEALTAIRQSTKPVVLKGVTGSGKTEVYFHAIEKALKQGKQCLILLPEIGVLDHIATRFKKRFGFEPAIWNSTVTKAKKKRILRGIINGSVKMVMGTRSALFLPYVDLELIVVDEEHDASYKQSDGTLYHGRDMAVLKGHIMKSKVILASATPSIETIYNCQQGKYELVEIHARYNDASLPEATIIDMRKQDLPKNSWISEPLKQAISERIARREQSVLFLNRRGYAPLMLCKSCGYRFECQNCSSAMVVHKKHKKLECHYCGFVSRIATSCRECGESEITLSGPGIERLEEEVRSYFPDAHIAVLSREQSANKDDFSEVLHQMEEGEIDVLIGTQIITKGYHFPHLTLVGVIDADMGLFGGDFRSSERTYQLLNQVAGRAGRAEKAGEVFLQTYNPENKVIEALALGQEGDFVNFELESREKAEMPPYARMVAVSFTGKNEQRTREVAYEFCRKAPSSSARLLGPAEAVIFKLAGQYRYRVLILTNKKFKVNEFLDHCLRNIKVPSSIHVKVDIDPQHFM